MLRHVVQALYCRFDRPHPTARHRGTSCWSGTSLVFEQVEFPHPAWVLYLRPHRPARGMGARVVRDHAGGAEVARAVLRVAGELFDIDERVVQASGEFGAALT
jgi:hypothetical protein